MNTTTYDVRIYETQPRRKRDGSAVYRVRWAVAGRQHSKTFSTAKLADSFRSELMTAARRGEAFNTATGLPLSGEKASPGPTWHEHAVAFMDALWPNASPRHRKSTAEALVTLTCAIVSHGQRYRDGAAVRTALREWSFNTAARKASTAPPAVHAPALAWIEARSDPLAALTDPTYLRGVLAAVSLRLNGQPAAASTTNRKRAALSGALRYAVETQALPANPLHSLPVKRRKAIEAVDPRTVVNQTQARALLRAVHDRAPALHAYFACMYFAALRPAEARNIRGQNLTLPERGWGQLVMDGSFQVAGAAWTDSGAAGEERELKHRAAGDARPVPLHPELVAALRGHLEVFGTGAQGRLFVTRTGKTGRPVAEPFVRPVSSGTTGRVWALARAAALTDAERASLLAVRPYDLRHACVSTWLAAGVAPTQVARWAGHSVAVLLRVYAHCIDGQEATALRQIDAAMGSTGPEPGHA